MEDNYKFKLRPVTCCENKTGNFVPQISQRNEVARRLARAKTEVDSPKINDPTIKRELSVWKDLRSGLKKRIVRKSVESEEISSLSTASRSSLTSSGVISSTSLGWRRSQYDEICSSGYGTPPWGARRPKTPLRTKIKMPEWTTEYFLEKTLGSEARTKKKKVLQRDHDLEYSVPGFDGPGPSWFWSPEQSADINMAPAAPPRPSAEAQSILLPRTSKDSIGSCTSLMAEQDPDETWDLYGPYEEDQAKEVRGVKNKMQIKLWPEEYTRKDDQDEGYEDEDWDADESESDETETVDRKGEGRRKRGGEERKLSLKEETTPPIEKAPPSNEKPSPENKAMDSGQEEKEEELLEGKHLTKASTPKELKIEDDANLKDLAEVRDVGPEGQGEKQKGPEAQKEESERRRAEVENAKEALASESESTESAESEPTIPSSLSVLSKSSITSGDWPRQPTKKEGIDLLFSSGGSGFSSSSTCGSQLDLHMALSDSEIEPSESEEQVQPSEQRTHHGKPPRIDSFSQGAGEEPAEGPPQLDFAPLYRQTLRRLRALADGRDPDADASARRTLRRDSVDSSTTSLLSGEGAKAEAEAEEERSVEAKAGAAPDHVGTPPSPPPPPPRAMAEHAERWMGPQRRAYVDLFQGDVNVILRTRDGHLLVVDLQILKKMDVFRVEINAVGDSNFLKKVHFLPQVSFANAVRALLWCSYALDDPASGGGGGGDGDGDGEAAFESDEGEEGEEPAAPPVFDPAPRAAEEPGDDPSADSSDSWLNLLLADANKGSRGSRKERRRRPSKRVAKKEMPAAKEAKEKKKKGQRKDSAKGDSREKPKESKKVSYRLSKMKEREDSIGASFTKTSLMKKQEAPMAEPLLLALTSGLSAGEAARLAADADALGVPTLASAVLRDLAHRATGRRLSAIQALLDPAVQATGLGQMLCYARVMLDRQRKASARVSPAKGSPTKGSPAKGSPAAPSSPKPLSPPQQQERISLSKKNKGRSRGRKS